MDITEAALIGFEAKAHEINEKILQLRAQLKGKPGPHRARSSMSNGARTTNGAKRGGMTPEGRAAVAAAQRKRWARQKREQQATARQTTAKRKRARTAKMAPASAAR